MTFGLHARARLASLRLAATGLQIRLSTRRLPPAEFPPDERLRITPEYKELNRQLHGDAGYGVYGRYYVGSLKVLARTVSPDILDYGCGKRLLEQGLGFPIRNYDPGIPGLDEPPEPADVVACTAVLEHVEPDALDAVLDDLRRVTRRAGFFVIGTAPAGKELPDGRNAHLIVESGDWWQERLERRFLIRLRRDGAGLVTFVVQRRR